MVVRCPKCESEDWDDDVEVCHECGWFRTGQPEVYREMRWQGNYWKMSGGGKCYPAVRVVRE